MDDLAAVKEDPLHPVREALRGLEAEGLVTLHPRRGFFVAALSPDDARELGEMRCALEALAVRLAAPRARNSRRAARLVVQHVDAAAHGLVKVMS